MKIKPLLCGFLKIDKSGLTTGMNQGFKIDVPSFIWFVDGGEAKILVDTSYGDPALMSKWHYPCARSKDQEIANALKSVDCTPDDIEMVIHTHLHWDHCWNVDLFRKATFIARREEVSYAIAPLGIHAVVYDAPTIGRKPGWLDAKYEFVSGDKELIKGVSLIFTPGHTPGHQSVVVETDAATYVIAGDAVPLYENLNGTPFSKYTATTHVNAQQWWDSAEKIMEIAEVRERILPGHDLEVSKKKQYP